VLPEPGMLVVASVQDSPCGVLATDRAVVSENEFSAVRLMVIVPVEPVSKVRDGDDVLTEKSVIFTITVRELTMNPPDKLVAITSTL